MQSAEQTATGVAYKAPKSGKSRIVALSGRMIEELRQHRLRRRAVVEIWLLQQQFAQRGAAVW